MGDDWNKAPFEQLLSEPVRNGIYKTKDFHGRGTKIVNMGELFGHPRLRAVPMKRVELNESEIRRFLLSEGDLIFARRSLTAEGAGKCSVVLELDEPTTFESSIIRARPDTDKVDPLYLYYFFNSPSGFHSLDTIRRQVAVSGITGGDLAKLDIPSPPLPEQRAIAHILGTLDDKIELNRRRNQALEAMARALFKDWFVDFGPVRAKMEGRDPYLPADLWQRFPDRLDDEGKPEGWQIVVLSELIEAERGLSYKGAGLTDRESGKPMHNLNSVLERGGYKYSGIKYYCGDYKDRHIAKAGDILVANTEQGHKHLLIGFPAIIPAAFGDGLFSHHLYRVRLLPQAPVTKSWLYYTLMVPDVRDQIIGHANGSTVNMLKQTGLQTPSVVLPPFDLCQRFEMLEKPIHTRLECNTKENETLAQLRDTLLPKLISGELRIKDADKFMERVA